MQTVSSEAIRIGGRQVGPGAPVLIIAEAGVNHNGDPRLAMRLVDVAVEAGADAVKFQTFHAEDVVSAAAPKARYQVESTGAEESQLDMLKRLELSAADFLALSEYCKSKAIMFLSSPFDRQSVDLLESLDVPGYKVPSGEITNWPYLEYVASKGKPIILSTGMSYLSEVEEAVRVLRSAGCSALALLQCTSSYPASPADSNLRAMNTMAQAFDLPVGLSDHTVGIEMPLAAVAAGACIVEKHFTLDKSSPGPDHRASCDPAELRAVIQGIRLVEAAMGDGVKRPTPSEEDVRNVARRSILAREAIPLGTSLSYDMLAFRRPGTGIPPSNITSLIGRRATRTIPADTMIQPEDVE